MGLYTYTLSVFRLGFGRIWNPREPAVTAAILNRDLERRAWYMNWWPIFDL